MSTGGDALYRQLCEHVGVALILADAAFRIQIWNRAAEALFGTSAAEMLGKPLLTVVPADHQSLALRLLHRTLLHAEVTRFEIPYRNSQGNLLFLAVTLSPVFDDAASRAGICAGVRDITRRVSLQKEVTANQTMTALGRLCAGVAHHFNNLLQGIATSVDLAMHTSDRATIRRALRLTSEAVARAAKITQSLLTFACCESQDTEVADLDRVVAKVVDDVRASLEGRSVRVEAELRPVPPLPVPASRVRTMLQNLFDNAVEAMPTGGVLRVMLSAAEAEIGLVVEDTGVGIPEGQLTRIFDPFFTSKGALGGGFGDHVGLGLAVVHSVVRELGGRIDVQSRVGEGTRFELRFPVPER